MRNETTAPAALRHLGPYELSSVLGRGGMGTVYLGVERETGREVAVKVLAPAFATEEGFRARFEGEIQSLEKLQHPNIVSLYGYGEQDGHLFYAMELVTGSSLHDELLAGRRFQWREVVRLGLDMCAALRHAHHHGVIHRDIKPANLLLGEDERLKLTDFGIAKLFGRTNLTVAGGIVGTADYMAPEQAQGQPVTPRTDLYSAGCVLYALLTGRPPFDGNSVATVIHKVQFDAPIPVGRIVRDIPEALEELIDRLLAKDPQDRVPTAMALAKQLQAIEQRMQLKPKQEEVVSDSSATLDQGPLDAADYLLDEEPADGSADAPTLALPREEFLSGRVEGQHDHPTLAQTEEDLARPSAGPRTFVSVEDREPSSEDRSESWVGRVVVLLISIICVSILGWAVFRLVAPPNADMLYARIAEAAESGEAALAAEKASIGIFVQQHASDPRIEQVREWQTLVDLHRLHNSLERDLHRSTRGRRITAVQAAMRNSIRLERTEPQTALRILKGLLLAYAGDEELSSRDLQCLELARRKIAALEQGFDATHEEELERLQARYEQALTQPPPQAIPILRGLEMIHESDPWAAEMLGEIRRQREKMERELDEFREEEAPAEPKPNHTGSAGVSPSRSAGVSVLLGSLQAVIPCGEVLGNLLEIS